MKAASPRWVPLLFLIATDEIVMLVSEMYN
jgi:hypothetical protein